MRQTFTVMNVLVRSVGAFLVIPQNMHEQLVAQAEKDILTLTGEDLANASRDLAAYKILLTFRPQIVAAINDHGAAAMIPIPE